MPMVEPWVGAFTTSGSEMCIRDSNNNVPLHAKVICQWILYVQRYPSPLLVFLIFLLPVLLLPKPSNCLGFFGVFFDTFPEEMICFFLVLIVLQRVKSFFPNQYDIFVSTRVHCLTAVSYTHLLLFLKILLPWWIVIPAIFVCKHALWGLYLLKKIKY